MENSKLGENKRGVEINMMPVSVLTAKKKEGEEEEWDEDEEEDWEEDEDLEEDE